MKRIGKSKEPTLKALQNITENLREKFNRSFSIEIYARAYITDDLGKFYGEVSYDMAILPGLDDSSCSIKHFENWAEVLSFYLEVIKEGLPSE